MRSLKRKLSASIKVAKEKDLSGSFSQGQVTSIMQEAIFPKGQQLPDCPDLKVLNKYEKAMTWGFVSFSVVREDDKKHLCYVRLCCRHLRCVQ